MNVPEWRRGQELVVCGCVEVERLANDVDNLYFISDHSADGKYMYVVSERCVECK